MIRRPSGRRKSQHELIELNLVPILDTMVTLIGFLLFTTSFLAIVSIESILPQASQAEAEEKRKEEPLQLTLTFYPNKTEISSPFHKIETQSFPNLDSGSPATQAIHDALIEIKKKFLKENTLVLIPTDGTSYDTLISIMDAARTLEPSDPPLYEKNEKTGVENPVKALFPKIVFGNLLGESH